MVILADFMLEFRFEFLWPFWLLLRSVYDSFKYQGLVSNSCYISFPQKNNEFISLHTSTLKYPFFFTGLFGIFYLYRTHIRHDLLLFHPSTLAIFCCQYIRLGAVCLAHRCAITKKKYYNFMKTKSFCLSKLTRFKTFCYRQRCLPANCDAMAAVSVYRGSSSIKRPTTYAISFRSL